jgi:hypothetical protein
LTCLMYLTCIDHFICRYFQQYLDDPPEENWNALGIMF